MSAQYEVTPLQTVQYCTETNAQITWTTPPFALRCTTAAEKCENSTSVSKVGAV